MNSETNLRHPGVCGVHRRLFLARATAGAAAVALGPAFAQSPPGLPDLSAYSAAERERVLSEAAKKEKTLALYTSIAQKDIPPLSEAFEKKYGVRIQVWRAASDKVLQRTVTELAGKRYEADVVHIGAPELQALHLEKALQPLSSPLLKELLPGAVQPHREWVATRLTLFVQAYNTTKVKREDLPKTWQDLTDRKWSGKLGVEYTDDEWFYRLVQQLGEEKGLKLFREIAAVNGLSVRKGHSLLANLVASGEVPLGLTVYNYMAEALKKKGAPIDWVILPPAITRANGAGILRHAPHPHAAALFVDYMLSVEAQRLLSSMDYAPTNAAVDSPLKDIKLNLAAPAATPDQLEKWTRIYRDIISANAR